MEKPIITSYTFSHGVLDVRFRVNTLSLGAEPLIKKVAFSKFVNGQYVTDESEINVDVLQEHHYDGGVQVDARYIVCCGQRGAATNSLVKAGVWFTVDGGIPDICCAVTREDPETGQQMLYYEVWFVDLTAYERQVLDAVKLKCSDCNVPMDVLNGILRINTVKAAVESQSPKLEYIYSLVTCGTKLPILPHHSNNCNCNG